MSAAQRTKELIPGILLCSILGAGAWFLDNILSSFFFLFNYVLLALILGLLTRSFFIIPMNLEKTFSGGIDFAAKKFLALGVILLGARIDFLQVTEIGGLALLMVAGSITLAILICGGVGKRSFGKRGGHLLGIGVGVCGVSAIMALAPVISARKKEIVTALATVIVIDLVVLIGLPMASGLFNFSQELSGFIAGGVAANTAQAVAIGHILGEEAGIIATITKSARNALMPVVILVIAYFYVCQGLPTGEKLSLRMLWDKFPRFVLGFLVLSILATLGILPQNISSFLGWGSKLFFLICFAGIGLGLDFSVMSRRDLQPVTLGLILALLFSFYVTSWVTLFNFS